MLTVPAWQVLDRSVADGEDMEGTIALFGASAAGLIDLRSTPVATIFPGVEIHANVIAGMLDDSFRQQPAWIRGADVIQIILVGLLLALWLPWLSAWAMTLLSGLVIGATIAVNMYWWRQYLVMPLATRALELYRAQQWDQAAGIFESLDTNSTDSGLYRLYLERIRVFRQSPPGDDWDGVFTHTEK